MKYFFRTIRLPLGLAILFTDWITRPRKPAHTPERHAELDAKTALIKLYQFKLCPFCVKTRRTIHRLGLNIESRDARNNQQWKEDLINEGGKYQVPCLRVTNDNGSTEWLYDSNKIIQYLDRHFS